MHRPRSIAKLMLIGIPLVLAPLIAAVVTAIVQVDRLAGESREAVLEAELATLHSRRLVQRLTEMRRPYLQYQVTGEGAYLETYVEQRERFLDALRELREARLTELGIAQLNELIEQEQALMEAAAPGSDSPRDGLDDVDREWQRIDDLARAILAESSRLIEAHSNRTTVSAVELQRTLLWQAAAVIPATLLLAVVFVLLITRPMRVLGNAIRHLGSGQFAEPINVRGSHEVEELGQQLDWLRQRVLDLEQQKLMFLRHISHELKTPLTTIREGSELLTEAYGEENSEEAEVAKIMRSSSLQLQKLIEELLLFGKTQDLMVDLNLTDALQLDALVRAVVSEHSVALSSKKIEVAADLAPVTMRGDEKKLRVIIDNLLSNAIKFTGHGGRVSIALTRAADCAMIDVRDSGPGVNESERLKIFEPFHIGSAENEGSVKGTGLGLSITREYVEAHNGSIEVLDSTDGAHFRVSLPVAGPRPTSTH